METTKQPSRKQNVQRVAAFIGGAFLGYLAMTCVAVIVDLAFAAATGTDLPEPVFGVAIVGGTVLAGIYASNLVRDLANV